MPYVHLTTNYILSDQHKSDIKDYILEAIESIPGKSISNTMIHIDSAYMFFKEKDKKAVFIDLRVYKVQPQEAKQEFVDKMCEFLKDYLNIEKEYIYFNILELDNWVSNGAIK